MVFALTLSTKDEVLPEKCIWRSDSSILIIFIFLFATYCNWDMYFNLPCKGSDWSSERERSTNSVINDRHLARRIGLDEGKGLTFFSFVVWDIDIPS